MSFIGTLEQFSLSTVLLKIEEDAKNGVLIIKQESQWVELSFRQGQLICIGPVRSTKTLGDRLLQAGVISQKALQDIASIPGISPQNETRIVKALVDLGYLSRDNLYAWVVQESTKVLQILLSWNTGEIYFDEHSQPSSDRLLIALTVTSLVPLRPLVTPSHTASNYVSSSDHQQKQQNLRTASSHFPDALTLHDPSQFYGSSNKTSANSIDLNEGYTGDAGRNTDALSSPSALVTMPNRSTEPLIPNRMNAAFMQPQMVLIPTDLSALRDRNLHVKLTPDQWRLFTVADGETTLHMACQQLVMSREQVCQVACELVALSLVTISLPISGLMHNSNSFPLDLANAGLSNSFLAQTQGGRDVFSPLPIETHSQWGNGGTGATFVLGNGWVVASSTSQPMQSIEQHNGGRIEYAEAIEMR